MDKNKLLDKIKDLINKAGRNGHEVGGCSIDLNKESDREESISAHYGIKDSQFMMWIKEMLCDMIMLNKKAEILTKWFKKDDELNETRVKVLAFAEASEMLQNLKIPSGVYKK